MRKDKVARETGKIKRVILCTVLIMLMVGGAASLNVFGAAEAEAHPRDERRVILCMGEKGGEMFVTWTGDKDGERLLRYSADKYSLPVTVPIRAQRTKVLRGLYCFKVKLSGLKPGKGYYYEIGDGVTYDSPRFLSVPETGSEVQFAYLGDPQFDRSIKDYEAWGKLTEDMHEMNPELDFAIAGGDMVNLPARKDHWNGFLDNCMTFEVLPLMTIPGNHEGVTSNNTYKRLFHHNFNGPEGEAFYYFDSGCCRFLMLDSSFLTKARRMTMGQTRWAAKERAIETWLREALKESPARWNIVVTHHPVYGMHDVFTVSKEIRELWLPIMKEGGVDLVLCGHQHVYMRTSDMDGIVHVMGVSGAKRSKYYTGMNAPAYSEAIYASGANYQIVKADEDGLEIISYNEKGNIIDAAHIVKNIKLPYFRTFW